MNKNVLLRHESRESKDSKTSNTSFLTDINEYAEIRLTPQNIDMFKRFLTNENRNILKDHTTIHETEIMPEYTDIERQITKKIGDMRSLFNIKNTIFKSMQSENSYTLSLFRKGFRKLFFGPKGIVTKKCPELKRYYKSFESKSDLNSKIYAGSLDYYDFLAKHVSSFNERLNCSRKKILELGGNFAISNTNLEKLHGEYLEKEKKRRLQRLFNNNKNNKTPNLKLIKNHTKSEKNEKNEENKRIASLKKNNLFLNYTKNAKKRMSVIGDENEKNKKYNLNNESIFKNKKVEFQHHGKSSNEIISIGNYILKKNNNNSNNNSNKRIRFSFLNTEANNNEKIELFGMNNDTKTFIHKRNKKFLTNSLCYKNNLPKCPHLELSFKEKNFNLAKTPININVNTSNDSQKYETSKLKYDEISENNNKNISGKNIDNEKMKNINSQNDSTSVFYSTETPLKLNKSSKKNFSLTKIKFAFQRKINDRMPSNKFGKSLNYFIKKNDKLMEITRRSFKEKNLTGDSKIFFEDIKNVQAKEKTVKKNIMTNINYAKKKIKNTNIPLQIYYDYESKLENSKPVKDFLKNIVKNQDKEKDQNIDGIREKFLDNIKKMKDLRRSLILDKKKYNLK